MRPEAWSPEVVVLLVVVGTVCLVAWTVRLRATGRHRAVPEPDRPGATLDAAVRDALDGAVPSRPLLTAREREAIAEAVAEAFRKGGEGRG
ncbi:hypothetical protein [Streptomyces aidingensis]|uniref:Uncharacterized protein n=1 Tax=Streptomyces aidingensis TaxID=910347 RepID=A0A1I1PSV7_9ACTN|nr:hypothetical protein [Streptomyces aidingensis]SFD12926.1 hypothetical protein SAMN05421773_11032 [Streptomyces aidingensis]